MPVGLDRIAGSAEPYGYLPIVAIREWQDQIDFLHRIVPGGADKSYGAHVAKLAGIGSAVVRRSRELLAELEANFTLDRRAPIQFAARPSPPQQLLLFANPADDILAELRKADPDAMTPMEALQRIADWRKRLGGG